MGNVQPFCSVLFSSDTDAVMVQDALDQVTGSSFIQLNELPDAEVAEIFKMTVAHAKLVKASGHMDDFLGKGREVKTMVKPLESVWDGTGETGVCLNFTVS